MYRLVVPLALLFAVPGYAQPPTGELVPLPKLPSGTIELRTVYLENPRFESITDREITRLLAKAKEVTRDHLGLEIVFTQPMRRPLTPYFKKLTAKLEPYWREQIVDYRTGNADWERFRKSYVDKFRSRPRPLRRLAAQVLPFIEGPNISNRSNEALASALYATNKMRLEYWATGKARDGYPYVSDHPATGNLPTNEWNYWDALARLKFPWEIVITNQLVAAAEYDTPLPLLAVRGGITVGGTSGSHDGKFGFYSWLSLFPFINDDPMTIKLRNGQSYSRDEAIDLAGAYFVHEIAHQLLLLDHPRSNSACITNHARPLEFRVWFSNLDAGACEVGSSRRLTPGAARVFRHPRLE